MLYIVLVILMCMGDMYLNKWSMTALFLLYILQLCGTLMICVINDLSNKYIILLPLYSALAYFRERKWIYPFCIPALIAYLLLDFDVFAPIIPITGIHFYISFLSRPYQIYSTGILKLLSLCSITLFVVFLVKNSHAFDVRLRFGSRSAEKESAAERERKRLTGEIHDTVGYYLTGISLGLAAAQELSLKESVPLKKHLENLTKLSEEGLNNLRGSLKNLRPDLLRDNNLVDAIEKLGNGIMRNSGKKVELLAKGKIEIPSPMLEDLLFRVVQEGVANAFRHGKAGKVRIYLSIEQNVLLLSLHDDGLGCEEIIEGFGLKSMRERLQEYHGLVRLQSAPGQGFILEVLIPGIGDIKGDKNSNS
ncbi:sensor histidine kinase [Treponema sp. OttesenSCG-928-L16]|nr:sensor histidine kinase [Treponema sp. OttesenSCG-928-L16]